jgi:hypothetical protein
VLFARIDPVDCFFLAVPIYEFVIEKDDNLADFIKLLLLEAYHGNTFKLSAISPKSFNNWSGYKVLIGLLLFSSITLFYSAHTISKSIFML